MFRFWPLSELGGLLNPTYVVGSTAQPGEVISPGAAADPQRTIVFGHSLEMKQLLLILLSAPFSLSAIAEFTGGLTKLELAEPTEFEGVPCKDEALLYADGRLEGCRLSRDAKVAGHMFPEGSWPYFDPPGTLKCVLLEHDHEVQGHLLRGESHHYQTCLHPNGWLRFGNLSEPTVIQGVPCEKSTRKIWLSKGRPVSTFMTTVD